MIVKLTDIIPNPSNPRIIKDDIVLDLFGGSGSTMITCEQLKRNGYLMELDPKYCQVIVDRMRKLNPSIKIKKNGVDLESI